MGRNSKQRCEVAPVMTRFSPSELADLDAKRATAGETRSGLIRAAVAAYQPGRAADNAIRNEGSVKTDTVRVVYDE